jgi:hypothetical protein
MKSSIRISAVIYEYPNEKKLKKARTDPPELITKNKNEKANVQGSKARKNANKCIKDPKACSLQPK